MSESSGLQEETKVCSLSELQALLTDAPESQSEQRSILYPIMNRVKGRGQAASRWNLSIRRRCRVSPISLDRVLKWTGPGRVRPFSGLSEARVRASWFFWE